MRVDCLVLEDFRNYRRARVDFDPGVNLVVGANAQGKTNLLEAVHCLSGLGSPRAADSALVREGAERGLLHAQVTRGTRSLRVDIEWRPGRAPRALVNRTAVQGVRPLSELTVAVFFGPDELSLIKGSPDGRRRFLDDLVVKLRPGRAALRREWERVLKQRNALLKSAPRGGGGAVPARTSLEVWDEALCRTGAALTIARLHALGCLIPYVQKRYEAIAGGGAIELGYSSSWLGKEPAQAALAGDQQVDEVALYEHLRSALDGVREREIERGQSLVGPQRDDVVVTLRSGGSAEALLLDARTYASQGDQRTCALALKLAEHDLLATALGEDPILLLDDVFSELDPTRRAWLAEAVRGRGQTLVSSAEPGVGEAAGATRTIRIDNGAVAAG